MTNSVDFIPRRFASLRFLAKKLGLRVLALSLLLTCADVSHSQTLRAASTVAPPPLKSYMVHSYLANGREDLPTAQNLYGKCLDYTVGYYGTAKTKQKVFLNDCSRSHPIVVEELNSGRHEVILHAGSQIIGIRRTSVSRLPIRATPAATTGTNGYPLELFNPATILPGSVNAVFALDGDSMILASSRCNDTSSLNCTPVPIQMVVQLKKSRSDNQTPLIVAPRSLADAEFWDFIATDNSDTDPTKGFIRVTNKDSLLAAMTTVQQIAQQNGAAWGSVIKVIDTGNSIDLTANPASVDFAGALHNLAIPTGVTIRGDRRGANLGPLVVGLFNDPNAFNGDRLMQVEGDYVRITGLRIQGPSGTTDIWPRTAGILIGDPIASIPHQSIETYIDHNEIFNWPNGGVSPFAADSTNQTCATYTVNSTNNARIERNFIHNDAEAGLGYGVAVSQGAGATILGNTFYYNRHAITADTTTGNRYIALDNLVLSQVPLTCHTYSCNAEQDFDVHGTENYGGDHDGGLAGSYAEIAWNTFLGGDRPNFTLRGQPCQEPDSFHNNVSQQKAKAAIDQWNYSGNETSPTSSTSELTIANNTFSVGDPTNMLGVGDFDGDGRQDTFLATGTTWFYSAGGTSEWRYLSGGKTDRLQSLLFGDFDGDGRTDVLGLNGRHLMISWGGVSDWEILNTIPVGASMADLAVGDFDGDGHPDIFYANGKSWYVSHSGRRSFNVVNTSVYRVSDLRFGHFSVCGSSVETDVFAIEGGKWHVSCGAHTEWTALPISLTNTLFDLYVADFDGDGNADIAQAWQLSHDKNGKLIGWTWLFSKSGSEHWSPHVITPTASCQWLGPQLDISSRPFVAGIGNFDGKTGADILIWGGDQTWGNNFCLIPAGTGDALLESRQEMR